MRLFYLPLWKNIFKEFLKALMISIVLFLLCYGWLFPAWITNARLQGVSLETQPVAISCGNSVGMNGDEYWMDKFVTETGEHLTATSIIRIVALHPQEQSAVVLLSKNNRTSPVGQSWMLVRVSLATTTETMIQKQLASGISYRESLISDGKLWVLEGSNKIGSYELDSEIWTMYEDDDAQQQMNERKEIQSFRVLPDDVEIPMQPILEQRVGKKLSFVGYSECHGSTYLLLSAGFKLGYGYLFAFEQVGEKEFAFAGYRGLSASNEQEEVYTVFVKKDSSLRNEGIE